MPQRPPGGRYSAHAACYVVKPRRPGGLIRADRAAVHVKTLHELVSSFLQLSPLIRMADVVVQEAVVVCLVVDDRVVGRTPLKRRKAPMVADSRGHSGHHPEDVDDRPRTGLPYEFLDLLPPADSALVPIPEITQVVGREDEQ